MSEPSATPKPPRRKEGVEQPPAPEVSDTGLSKTGGGQERGQEEGSGGMIGEADTGREGGMMDEG